MKYSLKSNSYDENPNPKTWAVLIVSRGKLNIDQCVMTGGFGLTMRGHELALAL